MTVEVLSLVHVQRHVDACVKVRMFLTQMSLSPAGAVLEPVPGGMLCIRHWLFSGVVTRRGLLASPTQQLESESHLSHPWIWKHMS